VRSGASLRQRLRWLEKTPFHPQWLLERSDVVAEVRACTGTVLDIGAADRWAAGRLSPKANYVALDYPPIARARYGARPDIFADGRKLPIQSSSVEAVLCLEVLEHVDGPELVLAEVERVLVPGGVVMLSMPFIYPVHDSPYDFQRWTRFGLKRRLEDCGLLVEGLWSYGHGVRVASMLVAMAITGPIADGARWAPLLLPLAAPLVLVVNLLGWFGGTLWPGWSAISQGHVVLARKP